MMNKIRYNEQDEKSEAAHRAADAPKGVTAMLFLFLTCLSAVTQGQASPRDVNAPLPNTIILDQLTRTEDGTSTASTEDIYGFWGHIQQYRQGNTILVTYPDNSAEAYENMQIVDKIQCERKPSVQYDDKNKALACGRTMPNPSITIGFKKEDIRRLKRAEKNVACMKIALESITNGAKIEIFIDEYWHKNYILEYKNPGNQYVYIKLHLLGGDPRNPMEKQSMARFFSEEEINNVIVDENKNVLLRRDSIGVRFAEEEIPCVAKGVCEGYAQDILGSHELECPYQFAWEAKMGTGHPFLKNLKMVYDHRLPH